jgi:hypothetical protein
MLTSKLRPVNNAPFPRTAAPSVRSRVAPGKGALVTAEPLRSRSTLPLVAWLGRSATFSVPLFTLHGNRGVSLRQHPSRGNPSTD